MATFSENSFSSYDISEDEFLIGSMLTIQQRQVIHNKLVSAAEEKLALEFTPNNIPEYTQREASLAGEIAAYRAILDASIIAIEQYDNPTPTE